MAQPVPLPRRRRGAVRCPVCGRPADVARHPFCSPRCADEDLRRWLKGDYRIPGEPAADVDPSADEEPG